MLFGMFSCEQACQTSPVSVFETPLKLVVSFIQDSGRNGSKQTGVSSVLQKRVRIYVGSLT